MIRIAAFGDPHFGTDSAGTLRPSLEPVADEADVLLIAGDLTRWGRPEEGRVLATELRGLGVPVVTVLGNHDYQDGNERELRAILESADVQVLEGESTSFDVNGVRVGVAGAKGFGGGFAGACATDFGEPEMKAFIRHTRSVAHALQASLEALDTDVRLALLHYAPIEATLSGERLEIYPFLGSYLLGEAIDHAGADLVVHGHAHRGAEKGVTAGGIHVRNVAQPVIKRAYHVFTLEPAREPVGRAARADA